MKAKYKRSKRTCRRTILSGGYMPGVSRCSAKALLCSPYCARHSSEEEKARALVKEPQADGEPQTLAQ